MPDLDLETKLNGKRLNKVGRVRQPNKLKPKTPNDLKYRKGGKPLTDELKKGDRVEWKTSQGETTGKVKEKLTSPTEIKGHHVAASSDRPEYLVESDKSGKEAAHKPESLQKVKRDQNDKKQ